MYVPWVAMVSVVYFLRRFGMQLPLDAMAVEERVGSTLNRLADRAFLDVLSPCDKSSMDDLIADFSWRIYKRTRTAGKRSLVIELH